MAKYFTQKKVAEMLGVSNVTINKYVQELLKELSADEKRQLFNSNNQPNEAGIDKLRRMRDEKNISFADIKSKENEELEDLKTKITELTTKNLELENEKSELNKKILQFAEDFKNLANQQQILQAQSQKNLLMLEQKTKELEEEKNKSFWKRLFNK